MNEEGHKEGQERQFFLSKRKKPSPYATGEDNVSHMAKSCQDVEERHEVGARNMTGVFESKVMVMRTCILTHLCTSYFALRHPFPFNEPALIICEGVEPIYLVKY